MGRKILLASVAVFMMTAFILNSGCGDGTTESTSTPVPPSEKPIELTMQLYQAPSHFIVTTVRDMLPELEALTQGMIKLDVHDSGSLVPREELAEGVQTGIVDIAGLTFTPYVNTIPSCVAACGLPYVYKDVQGLLGAAKGGILQIIEDDFRAKGYDDVSLIGPMFCGFFGLGFTGKQVAEPADLRGLKLQNYGGDIVKKLFESLGAAPMTMPSSEVYDAFERGLLDGGMCTEGNLASGWRWMEPLDYYLNMPFVGIYLTFATNDSTLETMPQDRRLMLETWLKWVADEISMQYVLSESQYATVSAEYLDRYVPTAEQEQQWRSLVAPILEDWYVSMGDKGSTLKEIIDQYNQ